MAHPQNTASGHTSLDLVNLGPGLVDIKGPDDDHVGGGGEIPNGHRDLVDNVLTNHVDVILELGGDGDNRSTVCDGSLQKGGGQFSLGQRWSIDLGQNLRQTQCTFHITQNFLSPGLQ